MSIIRSNIARQLLAEGGAPRASFKSGGKGRDRDVQMSGVAPSSPSTTGFEGSPEMGGRGTTETYGFDQSDDTPQDNFKTRSLQNQIDLELGLKNFRNMLNPFAKPELPPEFYYNKDMFNEDLDQYGLSGKSLERIGNLQKGLDTFKKTGELSQSDFEKAFFGPGGKPPKGEGGDNEPIKKLRAPVTEKKEEPKGEFDDILKFYGARFARGGSTGFEGSPEMGGRGTEDTYGFDQSGPAGDGGDNEGGPPNLGGGGRETPPMPTFQNLQTHFANNAKLEEAVKMGLITNEEYNVLGGYDARQTLGLGPVDTFVTSGLYNIAQSLGKGRGNQPFSEIPGDVMRNVKGASTKGISPELQGKYNQIINPQMKDGGEVRQNYGLGSIVKKATRAVKKVAKSPIGKAALFAGLGAYGLGAGPFKGVAGSGFLKGPLAKKLFLSDPTKGFALSNINPFTAILGTSLGAGLLSEDDEEDEKLPTQAQSDPEFQNLLAFYGGPRRFAAEGGMMEQDEMLDLNGNEMDLRGGGFVPLGEYEKKDDVPARLSKNEFVFTADAVRAAGGGSVDRGADLMYKTMKQLENKVV